MGRPTKQFKRFAASGKLTETIKNRRSQREKQKKYDDKVDQRKKQRGAARPEDEVEDEEEDDEEDDDNKKPKKGGKTTERGGKVGGVARTVDELFGAGGLDVPVDEGSDLEELSEVDEDEDEDEDDDDDMEENDMDEEAMARAMAELEKKDPEFFKHLKAEDPSLLRFGNADDESDDEEDEDMDDDEDDEMMDEDGEEPAPTKKIVVTLKMLRGWREAMLKVGLRSVRHY